MTEMGFWKIAASNPSRIALVDVGGEEITAGALLAAANRLVHGLRDLGLRRGDTIAALLPNGRALIELYLAAAQAGWYLTPINTHLAPPEVAYIVNNCDARALFTSGTFGDVMVKAAPEFALPLEARFSVSSDVPGFRPVVELTAGQPESLPEERSAGLVMTYTSGTTGQPRGVRRPLGDIDPETSANQYASFLMLFGIPPAGPTPAGRGSPGVHLVVAPLYHTAVFNFASNFLHIGHQLVLMDRWTPEATLDLIARHLVTSSHMVPTHFTRLLALPEHVKAAADTGSLRHIIHSAAPCPIDVKRRMLAWWGPVIYEYYAASEGGGTLATPQDWLTHPGTVGKAWPISEIRVLDDDGNPRRPGEVGTIYMRMGQHAFAYYKDERKTREAWKGGFFTVGDVGLLDEDGFLYLRDRKVDMIISGGVNIYPAEIEAVLLSHPEVADVAVFGVPDDDWGEQVKAVIEPVNMRAAGPSLAAEILASCREKLAGYKCPRSIDFVEALPRDPNGKLYKRKLRDPYWRDRPRAI